MAELLLRSSSSGDTNVPEALYYGIFCTFDVYCRQEVVGALVSHVGSGFSREIDSALAVLYRLTTERTDDMSFFYVFLKGY